MRMAEIVSSAVVQETVSQILSGLVDRHEGKLNANENLERLEMAHIKLEATLEISDKWQINDASLMRWRKKLKRAAQECDDTLRKCKQRILEEEEDMDQEVRNSSFPKRIARATKSFISSVFSRNNSESSRSIVRRFEWFADGASEFLRFVELGGTPRRHMPFDPPIRHLLAGKKLQHKIVRENQCPLLLLLAPFSTAGHGIEARLIFIQTDGNAPEDNFLLSVILQISESTDIVGIAIKCLQLFAPHFKSIADTIRKELTQLPTQDFSWVPDIDSFHTEHWDNIHNICTQWFRPNPLCCKEHDPHELCGSSNIYTPELPDVSLEPIIEVNLQCQVSLSDTEGKSSLKVGLLFSPHAPSEDMLSAVESSVIEIINGEEQSCLHINTAFEQLDNIMLPRAIDCLRRNAEATVYQMIWKSKHGSAYLWVETIGMHTNVATDFVNLWVAHAPVRLQGSIMDWIQKEKETQTARATTIKPEILDHVTGMMGEQGEIKEWERILYESY